MIHALDATIRIEIARYRLAFGCERCIHADPERLDCSLGYPNEDHRERDLEGRGSLVFCKEFELG